MISNYSDFEWGKIINCNEYKSNGYPVYTLSYVRPGTPPRRDGTYGRPSGWINELVVVDGRIKKLHPANNDEVRIFPDEQSTRKNLELRKQAVESLKRLLWRADDGQLQGWLNLLTNEERAQLTEPAAEAEAEADAPEEAPDWLATKAFTVSNGE